VTQAMRASPRPWIMCFQGTSQEEHRGRTIKSLLYEIQGKLGIADATSARDVVVKAVRETGIADVHATLHSTVFALCHHLGISTLESEHQPLVLSSCLKSEFDGIYEYVGDANGRPHWAQPGRQGRHLFFGCNHMWLLRRRFILSDPNASAFFDPFEEAGGEGEKGPEGPSAQAGIGGQRPLAGRLEFKWWVQGAWMASAVNIQRGTPCPGPEPKGDGATGSGNALPQAELSAVAETDMRVKIIQHSKWEKAEKAAAHFMNDEAKCGLVIDVKGHTSPLGEHVIAVFHDPRTRGGGSYTLRSKDIRDLQQVIDRGSNHSGRQFSAFVAATLSPKASKDMKTLRYLLVSGGIAVPRGRSSDHLGSPTEIRHCVVEAPGWEVGVAQCQHQCSVISRAGGLIIDVDVMAVVRPAAAAAAAAAAPPSVANSPVY
jgi:hypothetical protein